MTTIERSLTLQHREPSHCRSRQRQSRDRSPDRCIRPVCPINATPKLKPTPKLAYVGNQQEQTLVQAINVTLQHYNNQASAVIGRPTPICFQLKSDLLDRRSVKRSFCFLLGTVQVDLLSNQLWPSDHPFQLALLPDTKLGLPNKCTTALSDTKLGLPNKCPTALSDSKQEANSCPITKVSQLTEIDQLLTCFRGSPMVQSVLRQVLADLQQRLRALVAQIKSLRLANERLKQLFGPDWTRFARKAIALCTCQRDKLVLSVGSRIDQLEGEASTSVTLSPDRQLNLERFSQALVDCPMSACSLHPFH